MNRLKENYINLFRAPQLTETQREYVISGFSKELLENYKIIYSPTSIQMSLDKNGTRLKNLKNNLEGKLEDFKLDLFAGKESSRREIVNYYQILKKRLKEIHKQNMEAIKLNHLRNMNKIYSNFMANYVGKPGFEKIKITNSSDGGMTFSFK